ncbi:hypothetical protein [Marisediminicola senii]|uniref:hypothetical protein n=1 Tax=Marisediminicola senii TaxID=2711233 RepID=UPI0013ED6E3D|nr:hypothetical protein [Marisediminicola senii]
MIETFSTVQIAVAAIAGLLCLSLGLGGKTPNDLTLGVTLLVEVLLLAQVVVSIVAPFVGNIATGSVLEFWVYLVTAALLPPLAGLWALLERNRWSTVILGVTCISVAIMVFRMNEIWFVQQA